MLCLVPVLWAWCGNSFSAFALIGGYMLSTTDATAIGALNFAESTGELVAMECGWVAVCLLIAGSWTIPHLAIRRHPVAGIVAANLLVALQLVPYAWLLGTTSPLIAWGFVLPGSGVLGLFLGMTAGVGAGLYARRLGPLKGGAALVGIALASLALAGRDAPDLRNLDDLHGVELRWARPGAAGPDEAVDRVAKIAKIVRAAHDADPALRMIAFPEGVLGDVMDVIGTVVRVELGSAARETGVQIVVGVDQKLSDGRKKVGLISVSPIDGRIEQRFARQPMPVSLWAPWRPNSFVADYAADPYLDVVGGRRALLSICYEDLVPGLFFSALRGQRQPDLVLSVANDWWMPSDKGARRQGLAIEGLAKLAGIPLVRSVNLPASPAL